MDKCKCSHEQSDHDEMEFECGVIGCGCQKFRDGEDEDDKPEDDSGPGLIGGILGGVIGEELGGSAGSGFGGFGGGESGGGGSNNSW